MADEIIQVSEGEITDGEITIEDLKCDINDLENYVHDLMLFLPISLCTFNPANVIIDTNRTLVDVTGYMQDELMGSKIYLLFKDQKDIESLIKNTLDKGFVKNCEMILLTKDKKPISVAVSTSLRKDDDGDIIGYFVTFMDISRLKQMDEVLKEKVGQLEKNKTAILNIMGDLQETVVFKEKAEKEIKEKNLKLKSVQKMLKKLNKNLEQKVKERTAEVEKLLQQKDAFINQLSHDLKTPLTPLTTLLPFIKKKTENKELKDLIEVTIRSTNIMKNLVFKTLQLAILNSSKAEFDIKDVNLQSEVGEVIRSKQFLFDENDAKVENMIDEKIIVRTDKQQLNEVFTNLFTNAVKYGSKDKNITITVDAEQKNKDVTISVKDTGMGMTSEQQEYIFDEFYKTDFSRHDLESSGLGLSICKRIVEKHGGRIWVESPGLGRGSTFYFTLPTDGRREAK